MPWKNGGGVTEEIDRDPQSDSYHWRLSRACVRGDGPFSEFRGFDRLLVVTEGAGLVLNGVALSSDEILHFAGEEKIDCKLISGEVWDLGLIFDRSRVRADMRVINSPRAILLRGDAHYLYATEACEVGDQTLSARSTLKLEGGATLDLKAGRLVVISIERLS